MKRNRSVVNVDDKLNGRILILDRTPICVLIYSKSLSLKEKDYQLILDTYKSVKWREDYVIYLSAEPETILKRIVLRGSLDKQRKDWNEEEKDYLLNILSYYNQLLLSNNSKDRILIINTDKLLPEEVLKQIEAIITRLSGYSFEKFEKTHSTQQMNLLKFLK